MAATVLIWHPLTQGGQLELYQESLTPGEVIVSALTILTSEKQQVFCQLANYVSEIGFHC